MPNLGEEEEDKRGVKRGDERAVDRAVGGRGYVAFENDLTSTYYYLIISISSSNFYCYSIIKMFRFIVISCLFAMVFGFHNGIGSRKASILRMVIN